MPKVWWLSGRRGRMRGLSLLIFLVCIVYLWSQLSSDPSSLKKASPFSTTDECEHSSPNVHQHSARDAKHTYRSDGLLELNPNATHPVFELIAEAEAAWHTKLRKASVTIQGAIQEYVRRYKRPPPKGFDKW